MEDNELEEFCEDDYDEDDYDDEDDDDDEYEYDGEAAKAYIKFLEEKEERDRPLKEAALTEEILHSYAFHSFDLEKLEGNYIEDYGKRNDIDLASSEWAVNDLFKTGKHLPDIDPRTGAYGPIIASMGFTHAGNEYADRGEYDKALANFTKAIELNPRNIHAFLRRGIERCRRGDCEHAACEDLWDAVDLNPLKLAEKNEQSRALLERLTDDSIQDMTGILVETINARGVAFLRADMFDEAFDDFNEAIEYDPDNFRLYIHRGAVNKEFDYHEKAVADFSEAIRLQPDFASAYSYRAGSYLSLEKYPEAIEDYDKKISMDNGSAIDYINRAFCHSKLRNKQQALEDGETAIRMDPSSKEIRRCLKGIHRELKEYEKAATTSE